jgi:hypothetical protein
MNKIFLKSNAFALLFFLAKKVLGKAINNLQMVHFDVLTWFKSFMIQGKFTE